MRINNKSKLAFIVFTVVLISCKSQTPYEKQLAEQEAKKEALAEANKPFLGEWIYVDSGSTLTIDENTTLGPFVEYDTYLISYVNSDDRLRYLMRSGINDVRVNGTVRSTTIGSANSKVTSRTGGFEGVAGLDVILTNVQDPSKNVTVKTDSEGKFNSNAVATGEYTVTTSTTDGKIFESGALVTGEETDLGILTVADADGYNFKAEMIMDKNYVYGDYKDYKGRIRIHNIGTADGIGLSYEVDCESSEYIETCDPSDVLGSIQAGSYRDIPITLKIKYLDSIRQNIQIPVTITDINYKQWTDIAQFTAFQRPMKINIDAASSSVSGKLIIPGRKIINVNTSGGTITVPYQSDKQYKLLLANTSLSGETQYSIGLDAPYLDLEGFTDTGSYEPNNSEQDAVTINHGESVISYLHLGDLDYYVINMPEISEEIGPAQPVFHSTTEFYDTDFNDFGIQGNGDGILSPGETATFGVTVENIGAVVAHKVLKSISTDDQYVTVSARAADTYRMETVNAFSIIDQYGKSTTDSGFNSRDKYSDFLITAASNTPVGHKAMINLEMKDEYGNTWLDDFEIEVKQNSAILEFYSISKFYDSNDTTSGTVGDGNKALNAGETARFEFAIENKGSVSVKDIIVSLDSNDSNFIIENLNDKPYRFSLNAGEVKDTHGWSSSSTGFFGCGTFCSGDVDSNAYFRITVDPGTPAGHVGTIEMSITDRFGQIWTDSFQITVQ